MRAILFFQIWHVCKLFYHPTSKQGSKSHWVYRNNFLFVPISVALQWFVGLVNKWQVCTLQRQKASHTATCMTLTSTSALNIVQWITTRFSSFKKFCSPWENENDTCGASLSSRIPHHTIKKQWNHCFIQEKNKKLCKLGMLMAFVDVHSWYLNYLANSWVQRPSKQMGYFFSLICMELWAERGMPWTTAFFPWLKPGSRAAHCTEEKIITTEVKSLRLPVSVCWDLPGSWQRETPCCAKAATPLTLQKTSHLRPKGRDQEKFNILVDEKIHAASISVHFYTVTSDYMCR